MVSVVTGFDVAQEILSGNERSVILISLDVIDNYLSEAARLQSRMKRAHRRIQNELTLLSQMMEGAPDCQGTRLSHARKVAFPFRTVHFYAICWTQVGKHLWLLRDITKFPEVGKVLRPHKKLFKSFTRVRDHYEHFDERLLEGRTKGSCAYATTSEIFVAPC
jgi:hypothetical protein